MFYKATAIARVSNAFWEREGERHTESQCCGELELHEPNDNKGLNPFDLRTDPNTESLRSIAMQGTRTSIVFSISPSKGLPQIQIKGQLRFR
jgi:hypothetical protein